MFDLRQKVSVLLGMGEKESLFLMCGAMVPNGNQEIGELEGRKDSDGFVYLVCCEFDVFG